MSFRGKKARSNENNSNIIQQIYLKQGRYYLQQNEFEKAEICMVKANCPREIFEAYMDTGNKEKAFSFAEKYAPELINTHTEYDEIKEIIPKIENNNLRSIIELCLEYEAKRQPHEAIERYLQIPQNEMKQKSYLLAIYERVLELLKFTDKEYKKKSD